MKNPIVQLLIALGLFAYIFYGTDLSSLWQSAQAYSLTHLVALIVFTTACYIPLGYRLKQLSNYSISTRINTYGSFIGHAINNLLPGKLGELAKIYYIAKQTQTSKTEVTSIVFWEHMLNMNALVILALIMSISYYTTASLIFILLVIATWLLIYLAKKHEDFTKSMLEDIPIAALKESACQFHSHLCEQLNLKYLTKPSLVTLVLWALYVIQTYLIFNWLGDLGLTWNQTLVVFMLVTLAWATPFTPGAIGVVEATTVVVLGWYGIEKNEALLTALAIRIIEFIPGVVGGYLIMLGHTFKLDSFKQSLNQNPSD